MVREDILNWLKVAITNGENANDAAIRLIVSGHDIYEVNDALRQITSEIADKKFSIEKIEDKKSEKPRPSKDIPYLPKVEARNLKKGFLKLSNKNLRRLIWIVIGALVILLSYLLYSLR